MEERRIVPVQPVAVQIQGKELILDQGHFGRSLEACTRILDQHVNIWSKKPMGQTAQRLIRAKSFLQALWGTLGVLDNPVRLTQQLLIAMRNQRWSDVVNCLRVFRGATADEKRFVLLC